jgi:hypothetical protein
MGDVQGGKAGSVSDCEWDWQCLGEFRLIGRVAGPGALCAVEKLEVARPSVPGSAIPGLALNCSRTSGSSTLTPPISKKAARHE